MQIYKQYLVGYSQPRLLQSLEAVFLPLISQPLSSISAARAACSGSMQRTASVCSPTAACPQLPANAPEGQSHREAPSPAPAPQAGRDRPLSASQLFPTGCEAFPGIVLAINGASVFCKRILRPHPSLVLLSPYVFASRSLALAERWRQQIAGGSGPWVLFFILGSLGSFPQAGGEESVNFTLQNNLCPLFLVLKYDCVIQGDVLGTREQYGASPAFSSSAPAMLLFPLTQSTSCHSQKPTTMLRGLLSLWLSAQRRPARQAGGKYLNLGKAKINYFPLCCGG